MTGITNGETLRIGDVSGECGSVDLSRCRTRHQKKSYTQRDKRKQRRPASHNRPFLTHIPTAAPGGAILDEYTTTDQMVLNK